MFPTTLTLQLSVGRLAKLLAHDSAMQRPSLRQMTQSSVLGLAVGGLRMSSEEFSAWSLGLMRTETALYSAALPMAAARADLARRLRLRGKTPVRRGVIHLSVMKRPAGCKRPAAAREDFVPHTGDAAIKRSAFNRQRRLW